MRAYQLVLLKGLAPTRSAAARLIDSGAVRWLGPKGWAVPRKAGEDLPEGCELQITDDAELRFVSRGGLKLEGALLKCGLNVTGLACLDVGQSTGGFTDLLLQQGAKTVVGIDVGHGQLHAKLASHARVQAYEGVNARDVSGTAFTADHAAHSFGFVTGDLSFISLTLVLPTLVSFLAADGHLLMLVKPQFELQPEHIGKGGIVRDAAFYPLVEQRMRSAAQDLSLEVRHYTQSPITGGDGNREFFIHAVKTGVSL